MSVGSAYKVYSAWLMLKTATRYDPSDSGSHALGGSDRRRPCPQRVPDVLPGRPELGRDRGEDRKNRAAGLATNPRS